MFSRKKVRHTAYTMKNGVTQFNDEINSIIAEIEKVMEPGDTWAGFSLTWDLFVTKNNIVRIAPETDKTFIHSTLIEIKTKVEMGLDLESILEGLPARKRNVYQMVDLNYLGDKIDWSGYETKWAISINYASKRLEVNNLSTKVNQPVMPTIEEPAKTPVATGVHTELDLKPIDEFDDDFKAKIMKLLATAK
jgi:hypothetical protein